MKVVVPLGGASKKFAAKYPYGKNLAEIGRRPLIEHVLENLSGIRDSQFIFVIRKEEVTGNHLESILRLLAPTCQVVVAEGDTAGAPCTAMLAIEHFEDDQPLIIANGDQLIRADLASIVDRFLAAGWDGATITFDAVHPRWSFVRLDDERLVVEAAEKSVISRHATAGFYFFRKASDFVESAQSMIRKDHRVMGRFFVCPVFNEMILRQKRIGVEEIRRADYFSLATPRDLDDYETYLKKDGPG